MDEALAHGADTVLLMVSVLSKSRQARSTDAVSQSCCLRLQALVKYCRDNSIEPLVEVVTTQELEA